jgi:transcription-repair coupling factor (superfamily II helicase)
MSGPKGFPPSEGEAVSLLRLDPALWRRGATVHLPTRGAARASVLESGGDRPLLLIFADGRAARDFVANRIALGYPEPLLLPELPYSAEDAPRKALWIRRGEILERFRREGGILASTGAGLLMPFALSGDAFELEETAETGRDRLLRWLAQTGYERVESVWAPGQYVPRGGVVDVYDPSSEYPLRIEFFDERVESLRLFDPETQRSLRRVGSAHLRALSSRGRAGLFELLPEEFSWLLFDPREAEDKAESALWLWRGIEGAELPELLDWNDCLARLSARPRLRVAAEVEGADLRLPIRGLPNFRGRLTDAAGFVSGLSGEGYAGLLVSENSRLRDWAAGLGIKCREGSLSEGFVDDAGRRFVLGDLELTGLAVSLARGAGGLPRDWTERLLPGQWVVHEEYGIARFLGTERIDSPLGLREYATLEFAEERRLLIPSLQFHKIAPYDPPSGEEPQPDSIRGTRWKKAREKARERAEAAARELLEIAARRESTPGVSFVPLPDLERAFDEAFPYAETADQLRAIEEVRADLERPVPMDRILVGDVGYGKTEVALRAAFRTVCSGRQVAFLAPTTLLVRQHEESFRARFAGFPIRVESVSRFVPASRQKRILEDLAEGKVDVLVGTHRLLSGDVAFKDLGLVVVDEEHRFGVLHKERLKRIAPNVDLLMLSATPIPRTLHMALSGLRDLSLLNTPPHRRRPVITFVGPWRDDLVRTAILREVGRGGQVFYVHNRVATIEKQATALRRLLGKARVVVAHGRMSEEELESAMRRFLGGEADILVCTTIVESGLDLPRVNTLVVDDAHELGLAQMYQLRGRVGRREEQAYALFLHPEGVTPSREAAERLAAFSDLDELGAGYRLARRDLEIRGGGELLGAAQSGHASRIGFEAYCRMVEEAIDRLRGVTRQRTEVKIELDATIPSDWLPQDNLRVSLYRRLLRVDSSAEVDALAEELADRFGSLPPPVAFLLDTCRLRVLGPDLGIREALLSRDETVLKGDPDRMGRRIGPIRGFFRLADGWIGPGGYGVLPTLWAAVRP